MLTSTNNEPITEDKLFIKTNKKDSKQESVPTNLETNLDSSFITDSATAPLDLIEKTVVEAGEKPTVVFALWKRFVDLSSDSTSHGYSRIYTTGNQLLRVFWTIVFLSSTAFCAYLIIGGIQKYLKFGVTTKTRIERVSSMTYPMISYCNYKPFTTKFATDLTIQQFLNIYGSQPPPDQVIAVLYGNSTNASDIESFARNSSYQNIVQVIQNVLSDPNFNQSYQQALGYTIDEFFMYFYNFDTQYNLPDDIFTWYYDPNYGNCFRFNSGQTQNGSSIPLLTQDAEGYGMGIWSINFLDVFSDQAYSFMTLNKVSTLGLKFSIDDPDAIPLYYNKMLTIRPGTCTYINLRKTVTKNLPKPYSSCQDLTNYHSVLYDKFVRLNKTYSQQACYALCNQKKVLDSCGCALNNFPNVENNATCSTLDLIKCASNLTLDESECDKYCPLECESITYDFTTTFETYPDQNNYLLEQADPVVVLNFQNKGIDVTTATFEELANSMACAYFFFNNLETTTIEQFASFTVIDFLGHIGGSLGLCLGMSMLSFCEIFELIVEMVFILIGNCLTTKDKRQSWITIMKKRISERSGLKKKTTTGKQSDTLEPKNQSDRKVRPAF